MKTYLEEQTNRHPVWECCDLIKQCYQGARGAEHLLTDLSRAKGYFFSEWEATPALDQPLYEEISPAVSRVNLGAWKYRGRSPEELFDLFAASATVMEGEDLLEAYLAAAGEFLAERYPEKLPLWQETLEGYKQAGMPAIHHSESYRTKERPAYRVVKTALLLEYLEKTMSEKDKLHSGELYLPLDDSIMAEQLLCLEKLYDYNATRPLEQEKRQALLKELLAEVGEGCYIEPPFHANWGGKHVHFGAYVYANFNLTMVDDTHIYVGDHTMFGPNVTVATAGHPILPALREQGYQYNAPVHIGKNCWIGAGALIMPGVTIGDNTVIGAGSVVTKDVPAGVVAVGNPCRVMRPIGEKDLEYYFKDKKIKV